MSTSASGDTAMNDASEILVDLTDGIGRVTFNRPAMRNPLGPETAHHLNAAFDRLERDPACRVIILTGSGAAFCGGADVKTLLNVDDDDMEFQLGVVRDCFALTKRVRELELPVIAAVNGHAVGGGAALALACDIAIASTGANYYFAFGRIGASGADMGCTYMLPRHIGATKAAHLILTGATVNADKGLELGLFVDVVAPDALLAAAEDIARQIIEAYPRRAAANTKSALFRAESTDLGTCLSYEAIAQNYMFRTKEHKERRDAFLKRWD
jgi:enoyl-CoA hydratase/carnithine racemase